jgi:hypothetical protein
MIPSFHFQQYVILLIHRSNAWQQNKSKATKENPTNLAIVPAVFPLPC